MKIEAKEGRSVKSLKEIGELVEMMLYENGIESELAVLYVYTSKPEWKADMNQGVQVCTRFRTTFELELKVRVDGESLVACGLLVNRKESGCVAAEELRNQLLAKGHGQRFLYDQRDVKKFRHFKNGVPISTPAPPTNLIPDEVEPGVVRSPTPEPATLEVVAVPGDTTPQPHSHTELRLSNPDDLLEVLIVIVLSSELSGVFDFNAIKKVIGSMEKKIPQTNQEMLAAMRVLTGRGYIEKVGVTPARYRLLPLAQEHADKGLPESVKKKPCRGSSGGFGDVEREIERLEKSLTHESALSERLASLQAVIKVRKEALANARQIKVDMAQCQKLIADLEHQIAEVTLRLGHLQGQHGLVEDGQDPLDQAVAQEAELQSKLSKFPGDRERLTKLRQTLNDLRSLMGE